MHESWNCCKYFCVFVGRSPARPVIVFLSSKYLLTSVWQTNCPWKREMFLGPLEAQMCCALNCEPNPSRWNMKSLSLYLRALVLWQVKGIVHLKMNYCHHLLTFVSFRPRVTFCEWPNETFRPSCSWTYKGSRKWATAVKIQKQTKKLQSVPAYTWVKDRKRSFKHQKKFKTALRLV